MHQSPPQNINAHRGSLWPRNRCGPTIYESDWAPNEILALTAMFTHHGVEFQYKNKYGKWREECPYNSNCDDNKLVHLVKLCILSLLLDW